MIHPNVNRRAVSTGALSLTLSALAACHEAPTAVAPARPSAASLALVSAPALEADAVAELTRIVAMALGDQGIRQMIRADMNASPFREHKLEFSRYINGSSGGVLRAKMEQRSGVSRDSITRLLYAVRPLEFYMPIPDQRAAWNGDSNLLLVTILDDEDTPLGFDLNGRSMPLDRKTPPATPVISLVPVETSFAQSPSQGGAPQRASVRPTKVNALIECPEPNCDGGGGGGGPIPPDGMYMTFNRVMDNGEAWPKGAPEIEVHVMGPQTTANPQYGEDLACSGENVAWPRGFNHDDGFWNGNVLIYSKAQQDDFASKFSEGFNVMVWEDDDSSCELRFDNVDIPSVLRGVAAQTAAVVAIVVAPSVPVAVAAFGTFIANLYNTHRWLLSNDDYLGTLVDIRFSPGSNYTDANYVLYRSGGDINGRSNLVQRDY